LSFLIKELLKDDHYNSARELPLYVSVQCPELWLVHCSWRCSA